MYRGDRKQARLSSSSSVEGEREIPFWATSEDHDRSQGPLDHMISVAVIGNYRYGSLIRASTLDDVGLKSYHMAYQGYSSCRGGFNSSPFRRRLTTSGTLNLDRHLGRLFATQAEHRKPFSHF